MFNVHRIYYVSYVIMFFNSKNMLLTMPKLMNDTDVGCSANMEF